MIGQVVDGDREREPVLIVGRRRRHHLTTEADSGLEAGDVGERREVEPADDGRVESGEVAGSGKTTVTSSTSNGRIPDPIDWARP